MEVGEEPAVRPAREHVPDVDRDATGHRVDCCPLVAGGRGPWVGGALEACFARPLEEQRAAAPVCVRTGTPQPGRLVDRGRRRVVQHPECALAVFGPERVRFRQGAGLKVRARARLEQGEQPAGQLVRSGHEVL
eukprot:scaffold11543_cov128-Isochrysis_galbana.AAC.12